MFFPRGAAIAALGATLCCPMLANAAETVGEATNIRTEVTGQSGSMAIDDPVHRDERIRTSQSGLGQFLFRDGTKLAVGWGSSVTIDKFVFDDSNSVKNLTIKAAKGTFRWISGNSASSAYKILTPAGTIGVRGTAFDFYVGRDGTTAVVLLNGAAQICGPGGCRQLQKVCDCVVAKTNGRMTETARVNRDIFKTLGNAQALPFLSGDQSLTGRLGFAGGSRCGLSMNAPTAPGARGVQSPHSAPQSPSPPSPQGTPSSPSAPSAPSAPSNPGTPSSPGTPGTPGDPDNGGGGHDHDHDHHGHDHDDGDHDHDHGDHDHHDHDHGGHDHRGQGGGSWSGGGNHR